MFKKIIFFAVIATSFSFATSASAGWERYPHLSAVYEFKAGGEVFARWLGIPQYGQPTYFTCGATTTSMQMLWETHKKGRPLKIPPMNVHEFVNDPDPEGENSGLTTNELKAGQRDIVNQLNKRTRLGLNVVMREGKGSSIKDAVFSISRAMTHNLSPAIIYGNVKGGSPGGHYYLATGTVYCPEGTCNEDLVGLFINDSVYGSPAFSASSPLGKQAIRPRQLLWEEDLQFYWQPTGSRWSWLRGHMYLYNSSPRV